MNTDNNLWKRLFQQEKLPVLLQSENAECGLVCVCMIANYFGHKMSVNELRGKISLSSRGTDLNSLLQIGNTVDMSARPLRLDMNELPKLRLPAVIHWDMNHFVVLSKISRNTFEIHDPAKGKRNISWEKFSKKFTGVAVEFSPNAKFVKKEKPHLVKISDLWTSAKGLKKYLWQLAVIALVIQAVSVVSPMLNQLIVDDVIVKGDKELLSTVAVGMAIILLTNTLIGLLQSFTGLYLGTQFSFQLQSNLLQHAMKLPIEWFEKRHLGDIMARFSALGPIQSFITSAPVSVPLNILMLLISFTLMVIYSPILSFAVVISMIIPFTVRLLSYSLVRQKMEEGIELGAKANTTFMETIRGMRSFKAFGKEQQRLIHWQNEQITATNNSVFLSKLGIWGGTGMGLITGLQGIFLWLIGAKLIIAGTISIGMMMAFQAYAGQFTSSVFGLIGMFFQWKMLGLYLERIGDFLFEPKEKGIEKELSSGKSMSGAICAQRVFYSYSNTDGMVLANVSLKIDQGEFICITGPSGGGKTTLLKILMGLHRPTAGRIMLDNSDLYTFGLRNFRNNIASVLQDDQLFQGSIIENVAFFDTAYDREKVEGALKLACIYDDISKMPMGIDTLIGDLGNTLSGGQAQRVLLARAIYKNPKILFLDEATAHLDPATESEVMRNIKNLGTTIISVAHRPAAIECADRLVTVQSGKLIET